MECKKLFLSYSHKLCGSNQNKCLFLPFPNDNFAKSKIPYGTLQYDLYIKMDSNNKYIKLNSIF